MTRTEAEVRAAKMGLSVWVTQAIAVGPRSRVVDVYCVGFASIDVTLGEAESWEEAFEAVRRLIVGPRDT